MPGDGQGSGSKSLIDDSSFKAATTMTVFSFTSMISVIVGKAALSSD